VSPSQSAAWTELIALRLQAINSWRQICHL
jgi:hypothetical protein